MPVFNSSRLVVVAPAVAYAVAADVASYMDFLPLLESSAIVGPSTESDGIKSFNAELIVGYAKLNFREAFISRVFCDAARWTVIASSQQPPFRDMKTTWTIRDVNGTSDVSISIDYAMRSMMLQFAVSAAMEMAVQKVMSAFEARALAMAQVKA